MTTIGYVLAGVIAAAIIAIGARFLIAPRVAAAGYGVPADPAQPYLRVKGIRDIASGMFVVVLMITGTPHLLAWILLAATIIPIADAVIVASEGGPRSISLGVHGATAVVMLIAAALLLAT
ncbi:DUF4267 domain-containing protein [Mycobacterium sp. GA-2829]|uniref:DUF4267 domain-containing protein n=1 Tax=Mycobacterium sp. GA-2829 TaxID=1772283 RepID=UPI00073FC7EF|nr:DUF4267 domain-containing protein [Mycobacterium sp. GA-2829]KUI39354.1 hypothetical protein AU194_18385 [Mycobacterium sp. GA-2829]